jgi:hypothetical protein
VVESLEEMAVYIVYFGKEGHERNVECGHQQGVRRRLHGTDCEVTPLGGAEGLKVLSRLLSHAHV